jgi:hypothetical protein
MPAREDQPGKVLWLPATNVAISDAIGGRLLDDALSGDAQGQRYYVYLGEFRDAKQDPTNCRAAVLMARLGQIERNFQFRLRGDVLITGIDAEGQDADAPPAVLEAAEVAELRLRS